MRTIVYLIVIILFASCTFGKRDAVLTEAKCLMDSLPDSAMSLLDKRASDVSHYGRREMMEYRLLYAMAMNKLFVPMDTVKYMAEVLDYYKSHGSDAEQAQAYHMMGCVYRDKGNSPMALECFLRAADKAKKANKKQNGEALAKIYGQIALLFHEQRIPQREIDAWKQCGTYALMAGDTLLALQTEEGIGSAYSLMGKRDASVRIAKKVYHEYKQAGKEDYAAASLGSLIDYYLDVDSLSLARAAISEYVHHSGMFDSLGNLRPGHEFFYYYIGKYFLKETVLDSAEIYYRKLVGQATDLNSLENGYRGLMGVFGKKATTDSVIKYSVLFAQTNDSSNILHSSDEINRTQALYDYTESQELARIRGEEADRNLAILLCSLVVFVVFISLHFHYMRKQKTKREKELREINSKYSDALMRYSVAVRESVQMGKDLEEAKREKEKEINRLKAILDSFAENANEKGWDLEQSLMNHEVVLRMHQYAARVAVPSASEWESLRRMVEKMMPDFYGFLRSGRFNLTEKEVSLCILTRLHFIPSEIASLMNLTKQRVSNLRARLNKEMFQEKGSKSFTSNMYKI